jgi:MFS family permease
MGRFARSWDLTKASYRVIKQDKELLWMPILAFLASAVAVMGIMGVGFAADIFPEVTTDEGLRPVAALLAFSYYLILAFIALFFNAAVVAGAMERFNGGDPTVSSALRAAWAKKGKIFLWAMVVATVNVLLQALREMANRGGQAGQIVGHILISLGAAAWNLATAFMVPVLLFEDKGIGASVKSSVGIVKKHWGETIIANVGLGLAQFVVMLGVGILGFFLVTNAFALGMVAGIVALVAVVAVLGLVAAFFSVLTGVYRAALYRFATTNTAPPGFNAEQLGDAFVRKTA